MKERKRERKKELLIHEWKLGGGKKEDDVPPVDEDKTGFPGRGNRDNARGEKGRRRRRSSERKGQRGRRGRRQSFVHSRTVHLPLTERIKGIRPFRGLNAASSSLRPFPISRALSFSSPIFQRVVDFVREHRVYTRRKIDASKIRYLAPSLLLLLLLFLCNQTSYELTGEGEFNVRRWWRLDKVIRISRFTDTIRLLASPCLSVRSSINCWLILVEYVRSRIYGRFMRRLRRKDD